MSLKSFAEQVVNEAINTVEDVAGSAGPDAGAAARTAQDGATTAFEVLISVVHATSSGWWSDDEAPKERLAQIAALRRKSATNSGSGLWGHDDEAPKERLAAIAALRRSATNLGPGWSGDEAPKERLAQIAALRRSGPNPGWWSDDEAPKERLAQIAALRRGATIPGPGWVDDEGPEERLAENAAVIGLCVTIAGMLARAAPADIGALLRATLDVKETLTHGPGGEPALRRLQHVSDRLRILRALCANRAGGSAMRATAFLALVTEAECQLSALAPQRAGMRQLPLVDRFRHAMKRSIVTATLAAARLRPSLR